MTNIVSVHDKRTTPHAIQRILDGMGKRRFARSGQPREPDDSPTVTVLSLTISASDGSVMPHDVGRRRCRLPIYLTGTYFIHDAYDRYSGLYDNVQFLSCEKEAAFQSPTLERPEQTHHAAVVFAEKLRIVCATISTASRLIAGDIGRLRTSSANLSATGR